MLLKATCEACREITRKFEDDCLNGMFAPARARFNLQRKDRRKPHHRATVKYHDGRHEERDIGVGYIPGAMVIPHFPIPAIFLGLDWRPKRDLDVVQFTIRDDLRARDPAIHQISVSMRLDTKAFARMLCKIALGIAHYTVGPDAFEPIIRDFMRFGKGPADHFVGGFSERDGAPTSPQSFHSIKLWHHDGFLVVTIQLFAEVAGSPVNYVVLGPLVRMPPGLPLLHLGTPAPHPDKTPSQELAIRSNETIRWDQEFPSSPAADEPDTK